MQLNIAHKIFGIAIIVLMLMATVAFFSIRLTAQISRDLNLIATQQLPLSDTIGEINVRILEHSVLLERLFALPEESDAARERLSELDEQIAANFARAYELFEEEEKSPNAPAGIRELHQSLISVENDYRSYADQGVQLLDLHLDQKDNEFHARLPDFNVLQEAVDEEIAALRKVTESIADGAVLRADENERFLLYFNTILTIVSAILGLGFAAFVTYHLVRNVRSLVSAADSVSRGDLDVSVPVTTRDEVGFLSESFNGMVGDLRLKERIKDTFGKYMDPRIVSRLIDNPELTELGGERREMTVMFIDLQGYTSISERLAPADLVRMLNMFLGHMGNAVSKHDGVINDFVGDAVMAYWGEPFIEGQNHAELACKAAQEALNNFDVYKAEVAAELGSDIKGLAISMRIGISSGPVISGNIGSAESRKFSVVGDIVNLGARLEGANKQYGTRAILSERTYELVRGAVAVRELDLVRVKGKTEPTKIYELFRQPNEQPAIDTGLDAYRRQDWDQATVIFKALAEDNPTDPVPPVFLDRVAQLKRNGPGDDWDGVWAFETK